MKKVFLIVLALTLCLSAFSGCSDENLNSTQDTTQNTTDGNLNATDSIDITKGLENASTVKFIRCDGMGYLARKNIAEGELASSIIAALNNISQTKEKVAKLSDEVLEETANSSSAPGGTLWLEVGSNIYRLDPQPSRLSYVSSHMGDGVVLNMSDDLRKMINDAWAYYPYDYYQGTYEGQTDKLTLEHLYESESSVQVTVKEIEVEFIYHSSFNKITLELVSTKDQTLPITLRSQQSPDNLANGDIKNISLKAGEPQTVELTFGGFLHSFWIYILIGNTSVTINLMP